MKSENVHIVGGGIIGLCTAWYLRKAGCTVSIIEKNDFTDGASYGNAGMIVPSHFVPMAAPGVIKQGLKWLLDSSSPFHIKLRLNSDLIQWLWHFYKSADARQVNLSIPALYALNEQSKQLYKELAADSAIKCGLEERGLLVLYNSQKKAREEKELAEKANRLGMEAVLLNQESIHNLEPELELNALGGVYYPGDAHLHPNQLMAQLKVRLWEEGVHFIPNTAIVDFKYSGNRIEGLITSTGHPISTKNVVLATGSWSALLLKKLGVKLHLQDGKGYSLTFENPKLRPRIPTLLSEAKVALTPMGADLRIGGTLELSGLSPKINRKRVNRIFKSIPDYYKNLNLPFSSRNKIWKGFRPCTPDGLPYIGQPSNWSNLYIGTGHGMMGLSAGAITGKLLSELVTCQKPMLDLNPFGIERF